MEEDIYKYDKELLLRILRTDLKDSRVIEAIKQIPREEFLPPDLKEYAYINAPFEIGYGQTISQPYVVALMCQILELNDTDNVLDIGTGSGYQAAVLSRLCKEVVSVEIIPQLAEKAKRTLNSLGYTNVKVINADGRNGYLSQAPYDKIVCAASTKDIPKQWKDQLKEGGIIVCPIKKDHEQKLFSFTKQNGSLVRKDYGYVQFVPLVNGNA